jgi:hypothetical protein
VKDHVLVRKHHNFSQVESLKSEVYCLFQCDYSDRKFRAVTNAHTKLL